MTTERKPNPAPELDVYADVGWIVHWFAGGDPTGRSSASWWRSRPAAATGWRT
jgi:hypothetical protein